MKLCRELKGALTHASNVVSSRPSPLACPPRRRPTWLPSMRLKPLDREAVLNEPRRAMLASYVTALADLAAPKQAVRVLEDEARLLVRRGWGWVGFVMGGLKTACQGTACQGTAA